MKRQIRRCVFETNSSSSHSITIYDKSNIILHDIPKDSEVVMSDNWGSETYVCDELGKLNFVVKMLATIAGNKWDDDEIEINSFDEMINLDWFRWLAEVVKEESNTDVIYECPKNWDGTYAKYPPYYSDVFDDMYTIEDIFTNKEPSVMNDEAKFKERVKYIIYNPSVIIEDEEDEY